MEKEQITIPVDEYAKILDDSKFLQALMAAGVDSWEGYEHAQEIVDDML